ncbi:MAG: hypothetical protein LBL90_12045 [Prevotellaceae bacterium]|jgi:hypothetical protein|nr:hypothetical protein [Prevotellaceae bacterium]
MSSPFLFNEINNFRGITGGELKYLFHKFEYGFETGIIQAEFRNGNKQSLMLVLECRMNTERDDKSIISSHVDESLMGLTIINNFNEGRAYASLSDYKKRLSVSFISLNINKRSILNIYTEIFKQKHDWKIIEAVWNFDSKVKSITPLTDDIYFDYDGVNVRIKSSVSGGKVKRFLEILTAIVKP